MKTLPRCLITRQSWELSTVSKEVVFLVEDAPEGGYVAKAFGYPIRVTAKSMDELHASIAEGIQKHFGAWRPPTRIRLRFSGEIESKPHSDTCS